jgi:hypothetical protein
MKLRLPATQGLQLLHVGFCEPEHVPERYWLGPHVVVHCVQAVRPWVAVYVPVGQNVHVFMPVVGPYLPTGHALHVVTVAIVEYFPIGHWRQLGGLVAGTYMPGTQSVQTVAPSAMVVLETPQSVQGAVDTEVLYVPSGQREQLPPEEAAVHPLRNMRVPQVSHALHDSVDEPFLYLAAAHAMQPDRSAFTSVPGPHILHVVAWLASGV